MMSIQWFAKASAAATTIAPLGMLAAFALGVPVNSPFMQPWTCVAFLAIGGVLLGEQLYPGKYAILFRLAAAAVFGIGAVIWGEYAWNIDIGFDKLLFPRLLSTAVMHPGRPARLAGFAIQLIGVTLVQIGRAHV